MKSGPKGRMVTITTKSAIVNYVQGSKAKGACRHEYSMEDASRIGWGVRTVDDMMLRVYESVYVNGTIGKEKEGTYTDKAGWCTFLLH